MPQPTAASKCQKSDTVYSYLYRSIRILCCLQNTTECKIQTPKNQDNIMAGNKRLTEGRIVSFPRLPRSPRR